MTTRGIAIPDGHGYPIEKIEVETVSGTIGIKNGKVMLAANSALTMTLPVPRIGAYNKDGDDGQEIVIISVSAYAHIIQSPTKFTTGAAGVGTATLGGAVGDGITIVAYNGTWILKPGSSKNATFA